MSRSSMAAGPALVALLAVLACSGPSQKEAPLAATGEPVPGGVAADHEKPADSAPDPAHDFDKAIARPAAAPELVPARTSPNLPPPPTHPPDVSPHTETVTSALEVGSDEPTAGSWKPILFTLDLAAVAPPPTGDAAQVDMKLSEEYRGGDPEAWRRTAHWWAAGSVRRWNEIGRLLTVQYHLNSGISSRMFALLAVAHYDALVASRKAAAHFAVQTADRDRLASVGSGHVERYGYPSEEAAVAMASYEVLAHLLPRSRRFLQENALADMQSRIWSGAHRASDIEVGIRIGRGAGKAAVDWAKQDGSDAARGPAIAQQPDRWFSQAQTLPGWGSVRSWTLKSGDQFRAPAPPDVKSPEFAGQLAEIRAYSDHPSAEQLALAQYWNLGVGGISVPGMYDQMALAAAAEAHFSEPRTARTLALLNMAMMDASIACWDTKYHYLVPRPSMRDAKIREPLGLPTHPSYTSGHSAFSGAAEGILSHVFPQFAEEFHRRAEEASASRWYGGIHYRFDGEAGLEQGRKVAAWVLSQKAASDGCPDRP